MADGATADALYREARSRCQQGLIAEGIDLVRRALALDPTQARFHTLLGMALSSAGRHAEALESFEQAMALGAADAHGSRADALVALGRLAEAVESFDRALAQDPSSVADWCNRGAALVDLSRFAEAADSFARATALAPDFAEAHYNHGNALAKLARHVDAIASYDRALALKPDYVDALNNRANALNQLGRLPEALAGVEAALAVAPEHNGALVTRSVLLRKLRRPADAIASCDRTLMIWGEQGLGDEILHASMLPDVIARTPSVTFEVEPRLAPLFARSFPSVTVIACQPELYGGKVDAQEPLAGFGRYLRRSFEDFPRRERGYLVADAARAQALRQRLAGDGRKVIGLSWVSKAPVGGASKSAQLADFAALLRLPACRF